MGDGVSAFSRLARLTRVTCVRGLVQAVVSLAGLSLFVASVFSVLSLAAGIGVLLTPMSLLAVRRLASRQRRCALEWSRVQIATPYRPRPVEVTNGLDVAVVDVRLPPGFTDEGLKAAIAARAQVPGLPVLVLSQHVEPLYAKELLSTAAGGVGYLLKDRVSDVRRFIEAVRTVAGGGTAMDPEVVSQLLARYARDKPLGCLTPREREVLALMAEGRTNAGIAARLVVTEKAASKHISNIFTKLDLYPAEDGNRRVLAVLAYLNAWARPSAGPPKAGVTQGGHGARPESGWDIISWLCCSPAPLRA